MSVMSEDYLSLRDGIVRQAEKNLTEIHLKSLINSFDSVINSKRRSSYIRNFKELICILEKRDQLGEHNVNLFFQIIQLFPNPGAANDMMTNFQHSRSRCITREGHASISHFDNTGSPWNSHQCNSSGSHESSNSSSVTNNNNSLPKAVIDRVCEDIGTQWKDLARNLQIREGEIDEIEDMYPKQLRERAYECMKRFLKTTDPYKVQNKLLTGLQRSQRCDIKEDVEEILNRR